jgi:Flp pilus assembly protein TadD
MLLLALSVLAWRLRRRQPALLVGWLWFLGTLVPVIGLVQVGWQARADRYAYLPSIGLFVAVVWGLASLATTLPRRVALGVAATAAILACAVLTQQQVARWRDSETLFGHALEVTERNFLAHNNLGHYFNETGRPAEAMPHLEEAIRIRPDYPTAITNMGRALFLLGRIDEAFAHFERAYALAPDDPVVRNNLGFTRQRQGDLAEAERWFRSALEVAPDWAEVHHKLATVLLMAVRPAEAHPHLARAAELEPANTTYREHLADLERGQGAALTRHLVEAHRQVGLALHERGRPAEAEAHFARIVLLDPSDAEARNDLGFMLALQGRFEEAIAQYEEALRLRPDLELARRNLAEARRRLAGE